MDVGSIHVSRRWGRLTRTALSWAGTVVVCLGASASALAATSTGATAVPASSTELPTCSQAENQGLGALGASANPQVTQIAGGGTKYSYALPGSSNEYMTVNEPAQGFDPTKASDAELQKWGFPPRPSNAAGLEEWRDLVGSYQEPYVTPGCEGTERSRTYIGENLESENWSGQVAVQPSNPNKWHAVIGTFYNAYDHGSCSPEAAVSSWVGLGGWYSGRFMQTGTELEANGRLYPWIEIWAGSYNFAYEIPNFPIEPQNYIRLYAGYNRFLQIAYFYITNDHTGQTVLTEWHIGPQFYDGSTAEWIDEAPYIGNRELPLLNFGQITWWANTAQNETDEVLPVEALQYMKVAPWHGGNHRISWPGAVWNWQNWTDFYYGCV